MKYLTKSFSFSDAKEAVYRNFSFGNADSEGGQILLAVGIEKSKENLNVAEAIFDALRSTFFSDVERDFYDRFETSLREVNRVIKNLQEKEGELALGKLNVAIGAIKGNELHITQCGDAEVYLIRSSKISIVSDGLDNSQDKEEVFLNIASGEVESGDHVILSATRLLRSITKNNLVSTVNHTSLTEAATDIEEGLTMAGDKKASLFLMHLESEAKNKKMLSGSFSFLASKKFRELTKLMHPVKRQISKNSIAFLIIVGISFLFLVVFFIQKGNLNDDEIQAIEAKMTEINDELNRIGTRVQLEDGSNRDGLASEIAAIENEISKVIEKGYYKIQTDDFILKIREYRDRLDMVRRIKKEEMKLEASLENKRSNVQARGLILLSDKNIIFDENAVYESFADGVKDPRTIDSEEIVNSATFFDKKNVIIFFTESRKVIEYRAGKSDFIDTEDLSWHSALDVEAFNRNIYLLNPENNEIWKYERGGSKYGKAKDYNVDANIKGAVDMVIDGSIWVLKREGEVIQLLRGKKQNFNLKNHPTERMSSVSKIFTPFSTEFTRADTRDLFILEPEKKRVLVYKKEDGKFTMQFLFVDLEEELVDIKTSLDQNKLYLLTKTNLYSLEIN